MNNKVINFTICKDGNLWTWVAKCGTTEICRSCKEHCNWRQMLKGLFEFVEAIAGYKVSFAHNLVDGPLSAALNGELHSHAFRIASQNEIKSPKGSLPVPPNRD